MAAAYDRFVLSVTAVIVGILFSAGPQGAAPVQRIVAASNVRLRSAPQTTADITDSLSLGTVLTQLEASSDGAWFRVTAPDGKPGWVFASLTQPFNDRESMDIYRRIIQARLKTESLTFPAASELFEFVDRILPEVQSPARPEFDLFRLRAMARTVSQIDRYEPKDPAQRKWIEQHEQDVAYSDPAGQWLVNADLYWALEARYRGNPIAEEIAWDAANTGIPGECEGYLPCHTVILLLTDARYLDLYPAGSHMAEAVDQIDYLLQEAVKPNSPYTSETSAAMELRESLAKLAQILQRTSTPKKTDMLARLKQIEQIYR